MNKKPGSRLPSIIAVVSTSIAVCSLALNFYQLHIKQEEKRIENIPNLTFHYWRFPGDDWSICKFFTNDMIVNLEEVISASEQVIKQSLPGIKVAENRQFEKFKRERNRICASRRPSQNNIKNWKLLFVVNDVRYQIQIKSIEYKSGERDENLNINLEPGQGLLIPLGFTKITTTGPNEKDYEHLSNIDISWRIGDKINDYIVEVPAAHQRASGFFIPGQTGLIWHEPAD